MSDSEKPIDQRLSQHVFRTRVSSITDGIEAHGVPSASMLATLAGRHVDRSSEASFIAIDTSWSMDEPYTGADNKLAAASAAAVTFILAKTSTSPSDTVGLIAFNEHAWIAHPAGVIATSRRQLILTLQGLRPGDGTNLDRPLLLAEQQFAAMDTSRPRRILMITDGHGGDPAATAQRLHNDGVIIDVIGIGDKPVLVNEPLLRRVASTVGGQNRYIFVRDLKALLQHTRSISQAVTHP
jgi:Mg-chelatase subunit ChlD